MQKVVWMAVTLDKYELPVAIADTAEALGKLLGVSGSTVQSAVSRAKRYGYKCRYVKVVID